MERVAKRFLLHNNRDNEEVKESDFDELKQDMQIIRYEFATDVSTFKKNLAYYSFMLYRGLSLLGEYLHQKDLYSEVSERFKLFRSFEVNFQNEINDDENVPHKNLEHDKEHSLNQ